MHGNTRVIGFVGLVLLLAGLGLANWKGIVAELRQAFGERARNRRIYLECQRLAAEWKAEHRDELA